MTLLRPFSSSSSPSCTTSTSPLLRQWCIASHQYSPTFTAIYGQYSALYCIILSLHQQQIVHTEIGLLDNGIRDACSTTDIFNCFHPLAFTCIQHGQVYRRVHYILSTTMQLHILGVNSLWNTRAGIFSYSTTIWKLQCCEAWVEGVLVHVRICVTTVLAACSPFKGLHATQRQIGWRHNVSAGWMQRH